MKNVVIIALAVLAGMALASYDLRTDDTGIEVGLLLIASATLAALGPGGIAALAIAIVGALIGFGSSRASRTSAV